MALRLHWSDERYARIYCRDTLDWMALSWNAQALWMQLNRKATRSGRIDLGRVGLRGVAALVGRPDMAPEIEKALAELLADGCVRHEDDTLVIPDFRDAQEAATSGAERMRRLRERRAEMEASEAGARDETSPPEDEPPPPLSDETSRKVTRGYGTARTGRYGTARAPGNGTALPGREDAGSEAGDEREERRLGRVVFALDTWRTVADVASALGRRPGPVEDDLRALRREGFVESAERIPEGGGPSAGRVVHWRRVPSGDAAAAAGGRS